jgi:hypothetical protein
VGAWTSRLAVLADTPEVAIGALACVLMATPVSATVENWSLPAGEK